ncbi:hypothetical protein [Runella limosa]|uniref:hypothetical protein n=1 Tax=Runella limosa TaxID=370978 RepID=UPI0004903309|nr:hypothetical protein [Runella limosa]
MTTTEQTPLQRVVKQYEERMCGKWKPNNRFYNEIGINQKRFGMLMRGKLPIYAFEAKSLSDFFKVPVTDLF